MKKKGEKKKHFAMNSFQGIGITEHIILLTDNLYRYPTLVRTFEGYKNQGRTSGKSQWSKEACRKHLAAGLYFLEASSANPV